jgi:hypothetical protein
MPNQLTISQKLLLDFRDKLRDQAHEQEPSDGIPYGYFTEAQDYFMKQCKTSKYKFPMPLFAGVEEYPLDDRIIKIDTIRFYPENFNPYIGLPKTSWGDIRNVLITGSQREDHEHYWYEGNIHQHHERTVTQDGDIMLLEAFFKPAKGTVIDASHNPVIEDDFHKYLVMWALSYYQKFEFIRDKKKPIYQEIKTQPEIEMLVKRERNTMYGLDNVQSYDMNFIRW